MSRLKHMTWVLAFSVSQNLFAAPRFSGGSCQSQDSWVKTALKNSDDIATAISVLQNDEACKPLFDALKSSRQIDPNTRAVVSGNQIDSYANINQELSAISKFLRANSPNEQAFQQLVYQVVFNKGFDVLKDIQASSPLSTLPENQAREAQIVGDRIKMFLDRSEEVAKVTMETTTNFLRAIPASQTCLHNRPSQSAMIFSAVVGTAASVLSSGRMNGIPSFLAELMNYQREMSYLKYLTPMEMERFNTTVSCLVESTSETYCSMVDAEESLKMTLERQAENRSNLQSTIQNANKDPVKSPLAGMMLLVREIPSLQAWLQKVLFGIDPRIEPEAQYKVKNWSSLIAFQNSVQILKGKFRDKEELYFKESAQLGRTGQLAQIKLIVDMLAEEIAPTMGGPDTNFFTRGLTRHQIPFILIGQDDVPPGFNTMTNDFNAFWTNWTIEGSHGLNKPDTLIATIRERLWMLMDKAQSSANSFFAARIIVDPQNLIAEASKGPGMSPYLALWNLRIYMQQLLVKFREGSAELQKNPEMKFYAQSLRRQLPLVKDSYERLDEIIKAFDRLNDATMEAPMSQRDKLSQEIMSKIYDVSQMMLARDSFFTNRLQTLVQADIADTLIRHKNLTEYQRSLLYSMGSDILSKLATVFGSDPVKSSLDISQAKVIQTENLNSVEGLFSKVLFKQLVELSCKLEGGKICDLRSKDYDPATEFDATVAQKRGFFNTFFLKSDIQLLNREIEKGRANRGYAYKLSNRMNRPSENSEAHQIVFAKLCIQSLAFQSRNQFAVICKGQVLKSVLPTRNSTSLDISYDSELAKINGQVKNGSPDFEKMRTAGVCSFRTYLRKNQIYQMYTDFLQRDDVR